MTDHGLGLAVVSYHSLPDLTAFCESLIDAKPQLYVSLNIVCVETTPEERIYVDQLAADMQGTVDVVSTTYHLDNCGYARSCNAAACTLSSDPVDTYGYFNADVRLMPGALERCVETLWSRSDYGIVGPRQIDDDGRITAGGIFGELASPAHRGWKEVAGDKYQDVRDDAVTVSGSAFFIRRALWDELRDCPSYRSVDPDSMGAFLQTSHFFEETYCAYHAHSHGWKRVFDGGATIVHRWHKASPVGGWASQQFPISKKLFVNACESHDPAIPHD